jgi:hypothetical protein
LGGTRHQASGPANAVHGGLHTLYGRPDIAHAAAPLSCVLLSFLFF